MDDENRVEESPDEKKIAILEMPTVSENVMKFLPARDLATCSKISKSWQAVANSIKKRRRTIYVMPMPDLMRLKVFPLDTLLNAWSEPVTAIYLGNTTNIRRLYLLRHSYLQMENCSYREQIMKEEEMYAFAQKAKSEIQNFRDCFSKHCSFLHICAHVMINRPSYFIWSSALILVPHIPDVDVLPFLIPSPVDPKFRKIWNIEQFSFFQNCKCLRNEVKCMIAIGNVSSFTIEEVIDENTYTKTTLSNYLNNETFIVGGLEHCTIGISGIVFCGRDLEVEWTSFDNFEHFSSQSLPYLLNQGIKGKHGLAFLMTSLSVASGIPHSVISQWEKCFPKIALIALRVIYLEHSESKHNSSRNSSKDDSGKMIIVIVTFKHTPVNILM